MSTRDAKPVRLLTYANSPFGAKVYWSLEYKGVDFELIYVNPLSRSEIGFTKQRLVPVLEIGGDWVQDSSENCARLEALYPDRPFAGSTPAEQEAVLAADEWVNGHIVALHFRACIDKNGGATTGRNARRMANVILPTTASLPSWFKKAVIPVWPLLLRNTGFVKRAANRLDSNKDMATLHAEVVKGFEERVAETGFLAGTEAPSFADLGAFAEVAFCTTYEFEGTLNVSSSTAVGAWYDRVRKCLPERPTPALFPNWPPAGF